MSQNNQTQQVSDDLALKFSAAVALHLERGQPYALADFPDHFNVGDSAIYAGEMAFFDDHAGRSPDYVCTLSNYRNDIDQFCPDGPIFLHGGGNFGDVWPRQQAFRVKILEQYRGRMIVQLPQSIHFGTQEALDATARAIERHGNFFLLVRDQPSLDLATKHFQCKVALCPDAAHCLRRLPSGAATVPVLTVLRRDNESRGDSIQDELAKIGPVVDWQRNMWVRSPADRLIEKFVSPALPGNKILMHRRERMFRRQASSRLHYGIKLLERGRIIVSDRLHVHILSGLMGRPHVVLDNSYGKISRYIDAWGLENTARRATTFDDVSQSIDWLRDRLK